VGVPVHIVKEFKSGGKIRPSSNVDEVNWGEGRKKGGEVPVSITRPGSEGKRRRKIEGLGDLPTTLGAGDGTVTSAALMRGVRVERQNLGEISCPS